MYVCVYVCVWGFALSMHAFGAYPGLCPQWVSEVICHEKGDWRGEVCVSVPKRRGKGLSKKEKKKKLCWWAFKEWYPGPDNGTSIREWSSRGGYGDKDSYDIDTQEKLGGVSEMPCATRATCVAFLRDQVQSLVQCQMFPGVWTVIVERKWGHEELTHGSGGKRR